MNPPASPEKRIVDCQQYGVICEMDPEQTRVRFTWRVFRHDDNSYGIVFIDHETHTMIDLPSSVTMTNLKTRALIMPVANSAWEHYALDGDCDAIMALYGTPVWTNPEMASAL